MLKIAVASTGASTPWWVFLLQGGAGAVLGVMLIAEASGSVVTLTTFLGFYWLITGVLGLVRVFTDRSVPWIWPLLVGIIGLASGILVSKHPLVAAVTEPTVLVGVLGVDGLIMGVLDIVGVLSGGGTGWFMIGATNILVGALLLSSVAVTALAVPLIFGLLLVVQGIARHLGFPNPGLRPHFLFRTSGIN